MNQQRLIANLAVLFAGLAAFLIAIGLHGTVSYGISRRTMEVGIRMALGAKWREVLRMILWESLSAAGVGLAIGIPASHGPSAADPLVALAPLLPARRAASIDPIRALHMD